MGKQKEYEHVTCIFVHRTDRAILIDLSFDPDETDQQWVPLSVIKDGESYSVEEHATEKVTLEIERWFCEKNDISN